MRTLVQEDWVAQGGDRRDEISDVLQVPRRLLSECFLRLAKENRLSSYQRSALEITDEDPPQFVSDYALSRGSQVDPVFRRYAFELRSPADWVFSVDGDDRWRGGVLATDELFELIAVAALEPLLPQGEL